MPLGDRISIVGASGSGKTTLGKRIAELRGIPFVELDSIHHGPNWTHPPAEEFEAAVDAATQGTAWVVDGNYSAVRHIVWSRADTIVWLDYGMWLSLRQVGRRTFTRFLRREELWNGNRESLWKHFLPWDESLFWWVLKTHRRRRRDYLAAMRDPRYAGKFVRVTRQGEAEGLLSQSLHHS